MKKHICKAGIFTVILSFVLLLNLFFYKFNDFYTNKNITIPTMALLPPDKTEITQVIRNIYNDRCSMFITKDLTNLPSYYDSSQKLGKWSLGHEVKRLNYFNDWSSQRGMNFTKVESTPNVRKVTTTKRGLSLLVDEYYKFEYSYKNDITPTTNVFGVGLTHSMELIKKDEKWIIYSDWYLDCFEDALKSYVGELKNFKLAADKKAIYNLGNCPKISSEVNVVPKGGYDKISAVKYADKYCGIPWASGNSTKYNKKYTNYTGNGGNCTNYVSQSIGDSEGGGLRFDSIWQCTYKKYGGADGSSAWVNADAFKNYLLYSGRGKLLGKGTFNQLISPLPGYPCGAMQKLDIGDLICYAKGSDIDHFAIVTGFDSHGYPLVNTHTIDRYHVPWDLGWGDKNINFYLIHLK
ncbi:amidase domain-containing protein [Clostridium tagluense]|uniref:amidase domain-containing protein n=1 Tax=Clostridium TaxID=1485 RepID=UPI0013E965B5|nr:MULTISPECIES: amidase domain-containing protein [Clostridium]MBU3127822.1 amidase domain-containing protein [Clostridium tagluense]MBZ9622426.1 amidase domain-containing protein [Clostridium sp. FP2]MCB2310152.1 amidase domain-containing protein [Clostridium tagluense]MCB2315206.1 amidase domain-containing protein [Clostridium tagluense]MCB2319852.1 amidase domain-containing protein [Clostridium tagluense]